MKARPEQENQDRVADLAEEHVGRAHPVGAKRIRPELPQPLRSIVRREPICAASEPREHLIRRQAGSLGRIQLAWRSARDRDHGSSITVPARSRQGHWS